MINNYFFKLIDNAKFEIDFACLDAVFNLYINAFPTVLSSSSYFFFFFLKYPLIAKKSIFIIIIGVIIES